MKEPIEEKVVKGSPLAGITFKRREREGESEKGGETSGKRRRGRERGIMRSSLLNCLLGKEVQAYQRSVGGSSGSDETLLFIH